MSRPRVRDPPKKSHNVDVAADRNHRSEEKVNVQLKTREKRIWEKRASRDVALAMPSSCFLSSSSASIEPISFVSSSSFSSSSSSSSSSSISESLAPVGLLSSSSSASVAPSSSSSLFDGIATTPTTKTSAELEQLAVEFAQHLKSNEWQKLGGVCKQLVVECKNSSKSKTAISVFLAKYKLLTAAIAHVQDPVTIVNLLTQVVSNNPIPVCAWLQNNTDIVKYFVRLLQASFADAQDCADALTLCNEILSQYAPLRDLLLSETKVLATTIAWMRKYQSNESVLTAAAMCMSGLFYIKDPAVDFDQVKQVLPYLVDIADKSKCDGAVANAMESFQLMSDEKAGDAHLEVLHKAGVLPIVVRSILSTNQPDTLLVALKTFASFASAKSFKVLSMVTSQFLSTLVGCATNDISDKTARHIRCEALYSLSGLIADDDADFNNALLQRDQFLPKLVEIIKTNSFKVQFEAIFVLCNLGDTASSTSRKLINDSLAIESLCEALKTHKKTLVVDAILGEFNRMLVFDPKCTVRIEETGGVERLEEKQRMLSESSGDEDDDKLDADITTFLDKYYPDHADNEIEPDQKDFISDDDDDEESSGNEETRDDDKKYSFEKK